MYDKLIKRLRDAAKMSETLAVLLPHSEGNATAKLYREAADTIEELSKKRTGVWIPITTRPMTEDERKEWSDNLDFNINDDEAIIYGNLPDDGQSVLIFKEYSNTVDIDTFFDDDEGCYFEDNGDMDGITHWMPLPKPPKEVEK